MWHSKGCWLWHVMLEMFSITNKLCRRLLALLDACSKLHCHMVSLLNKYLNSLFKDHCFSGETQWPRKKTNKINPQTLTVAKTTSALTLSTYKHSWVNQSDLYQYVCLGPCWYRHDALIAAGICMAARLCLYLAGVRRSLIHLTFWLICMRRPPRLRDAMTFIS